MSTYSPDLRIELITTGDQAGTWGNTTNSNLSNVIEQAIAGYVSVAVSSANQALTYINGGSPTPADNQSVFAAIALTTSTAANFAVYAPPVSKQYTIYNASAYVATIYNSTVIGNTTAAGTGIAIPAGKVMTVWSDGANFAVQNSHLAAVSIGGSAAATPVVVTFSATAMTVNCVLSNVFTTTFTTNVTVAPTLSNPTDGQTINWFITQDATGGRTIVWPASFKWAGGATFAGVLSTSPNAVDLVVATYRSATGFWYASLSKGFA
jgi:hypothetical protein